MLCHLSKNIRPTNCWSSVASYLQHFLSFPEVSERQELLELASNNSVLVLSSCACFPLFRAAHFEVHPELSKKSLRFSQLVLGPHPVTVHTLPKKWRSLSPQRIRKKAMPLRCTSSLTRNQRVSTFVPRTRSICAHWCLPTKPDAGAWQPFSSQVNLGSRCTSQSTRC